MKFRNASGTEMMIVHCAWGNAMWKGLKGCKIVDDFLRIEHVDTLVKEWGYAEPEDVIECGRPAFVCDNKSDVSFIFCPADRGVAAFAHEVGHAVCDKLYPQSRGWNAEKAEAFALLSDVNVPRYRTLEPSERQSFNEHIRACRNNPAYERPLRWAFSLRGRKLEDQMEAIANG